MGRPESGNRKLPLVGTDRELVKRILAVLARKTIHYGRWYYNTSYQTRALQAPFGHLFKLAREP